MVARGTFHGVVDRNIGEYGKQEPGHHYFFAPDFVRERSEDNQERHAHPKRSGLDDNGRAGIELQNGLQVEEGVELPGIRHHALSGRCAEQRDQDLLQVGPLGESVLERLKGSFSGSLEVREDWRFAQLHSDIDGNADEKKRK